MFGIILGTKFGQSQMFDQEGKRIPVSRINTADCYLIKISSLKDGRKMIMIGFQEAKNINKAQLGILKKAGIDKSLRYIREFILPNDIEIVDEENRKGIIMNDQKVLEGQVISPRFFFKEGDTIDVAGTSKGKGFQGVVKRHGFRGGPRTHGQSDRERAPGSVGQTTTPGRIYKGKRMAGRMGGERVTIKNLSVIGISDDGVIQVSGLVPGARNGLLEVSLTHI